MSELALHIIHGPDSRRETEHVETKWCFHCRAHLPHRWVVLYDSKPSYYDPIGLWECPRCHRDETDFPGTESYYEEPY